ncbi:MAG: hypothetical protein AB7F50_05900 [Fimbriimonadaceae bacterium]
MEAESRIPYEWEGGKFHTRVVYLTLNQGGPAYPTLTGGNHIDLGLDATNGEMFSVSVQSGLRFEPTPARVVSREEAVAALRAAVDIGELLEVRGPAYMELLGSGDSSADGRLFKERAVLPLVYSITGGNYHGAVHAGTGKVLRTRQRNIVSSLAPTTAEAAPSSGPARETEPGSAASGSVVPVVLGIAVAFGLG